MKNDRAQRRMDELLSAYLDGELSPRERARLEARLATDPELRERLEGLRRTVALVRGLPQVQAPRNFLLTPAMVAPVRRRPAPRRWLAPALTFATTLSALACAAVLMSNLLLSGLGGFGTVAPAAPPREVAQEQPTEAPTAEAFRGGPTPPAVEMAPAAAEALTRTQALTETTTPVEEGPPPSPIPSPYPLPEAEDQEAEKVVPTPTSPPAAEEGEALGMEATPTPPPTVGREARPIPLFPLLPVVGLAALTLGLAVATVWAWRTRG